MHPLPSLPPPSLTPVQSPGASPQSRNPHAASAATHFHAPSTHTATHPRGPPSPRHRSPSCKVQAPAPKADVLMQPAQPVLEGLTKLWVGMVQVRSRAVVITCGSNHAAWSRLGAGPYVVACCSNHAAWLRSGAGHMLSPAAAIRQHLCSIHAAGQEPITGKACCMRCLLRAGTLCRSQRHNYYEITNNKRLPDGVRRGCYHRPHQHGLGHSYSLN